MSEVAGKLALARAALRDHGLSALRLRGTDWYAWITGGASSVVLMAAETGVAEALVTTDAAFVLTDVIEAPRLQAEGLAENFVVCSHPWQQPAQREAFVRKHVGTGTVASDRPCGEEVAIPADLTVHKLALVAGEVERYAALGVRTAEAMTEALSSARPEWSEFDLAACCSHALVERGIEPLLVQAGGEERLLRFRHLLPTAAALGARAMLAVCARRYGLVASASRFVYFRTPTNDEQRGKHDLAAIEAAAFVGSRPGQTMQAVYAALEHAYERAGYGREIDNHHQGGITGYRAREVLAAPGVDVQLPACCALAWNPSLPGVKIEDTVIADADGVHILTVDPAWPTFMCGANARPDFLVR